MRTATNIADQSYQTALQQRRSGDRDGARRLCEQLVARFPRHGNARQLLSELLIEDGAPERAARQLEILLADRPDDPATLYMLGRTYALLGDIAAARDCLTDALEGRRDAPEIYSTLALLESNDGNDGEAEAVLRRGLQACPAHPDLLTNLGNLLARADRLDEALDLLRQALDGGEDTPIVHHNLGKVLSANGDDAAAAQHLRRAVELDPRLQAAWQQLGNALKDLGEVAEAAVAYDQGFRLRRGHAAPAAAPRVTSRSKLLHDIEQFEHLAARGLRADGTRALAQLYREVLDRLPATQRDSDEVALTAADSTHLAPSYNRLIHLADAPVLPEGAVNPALDRAAIEADFAANAPGITVVDDFLSPAALEALRRFCLESTIWYRDSYANGYLGAFIEDGFNAPLLHQIAEEMRLALPGIFGRHLLRKLWAFKYDSRLSGIPMHADFAAVNVNFWITPDSANLDPEGGGLVIWDKEAPLDWDFSRYNTDEAAMRTFLAESGARAINVPHRCNRVVIFNSDLFHETGPLHFREGYENRRLNITMLYGKRDA